MPKMNCWEFKKCGREPGGLNIHEHGVCPAATESGTNGVNGGYMAGRTCWAIAGTLCFGKVRGIFARKIANCLACEFYMKVKLEEAENFVMTSNILKLLRQ
ncbi:MAG: two-CW domain-containing protein [Planctomycetota bacterium]|jgi:hypothetical protein